MVGQRKGNVEERMKVRKENGGEGYDCEWGWG